MKGNGWLELPKTKRMVYVRRGSVSHAAVHVDGERIVQIPYKDAGNGKLVRLSERLSFKDVSRLEIAKKIIWIEIQVAKNFLSEDCAFSENRVRY